jgi:hypothetical protein
MNLLDGDFEKMKAIFLAGYDLIKDESRWTTGAFARVAPDGEAVNCMDGDAKCWCLMGAMQRGSHDLFNSRFYEYQLVDILLNDMEQSLSTSSDYECQMTLGWLNDERGHAVVMEFLETYGRKVGYISS